ncbi:MAG: methylated-DNA--[protein]-cysteine S-methyltransferase [Bacteroidia bacterium]
MATLAQDILQFKIIETPIGRMLGCANQEGICILEFTDDSEKTLKIISNVFRIELNRSYNPHLENLKIQLDEYFSGLRKEFSLNLDITGSNFQKNVWALLLQIPYGTTQTYKQQADRLKQPLGIRAMAHANGQNPLIILVPCHRVIGSNGKLSGYSGGLWRKRWLLEHERVNSPLGDKLL